MGEDIALSELTLVALVANTRSSRCCGPTAPSTKCKNFCRRIHVHVISVGTYSLRVQGALTQRASRTQSPSQSLKNKNKQQESFAFAMDRGPWLPAAVDRTQTMSITLFTLPDSTLARHMGEETPSVGREALCMGSDDTGIRDAALGGPSHS